MDRSLGFGSTDADETPYSDSLSLRLRLFTLTKPAPRNSQVHSSIGTRLALLAHGPFTVCKHTVSCSISLPFGGSFHLSLTVLCAIGHDRIFSLGRWSSQLQTGFLVPRLTHEQPTESDPLSPTGLSPSLARLSSRLRLTIGFVTQLEL
jgi:hypothetical protein